MRNGTEPLDPRDPIRVPRRPEHPPIADGAQPELLIGTAAHLHAAYARAAAASARAEHLALQRFAGAPHAANGESPSERTSGELAGLRALVRASATAYARHLRQSRVTPEHMLVLVKKAAVAPPTAGLAGQDLTRDVVRWSIEAYFAD